MFNWFKKKDTSPKSSDDDVRKLLYKYPELNSVSQFWIDFENKVMAKHQEVYIAAMRGILGESLDEMRKVVLTAKSIKDGMDIDLSLRINVASVGDRQEEILKRIDAMRYLSYTHQRRYEKYRDMENEMWCKAQKEAIAEFDRMDAELLKITKDIKSEGIK